ncbi:chemotaxis response regulator protein-glutamate methylesterase [Desulfoferrobacter suflitae]|uniref:chemotaxis response regulator protein-glutamate methylesterase n=1 Tax=Desulfoferrobacter suflitae TaxID=2865782 RepID=UPI0021647D0B|nr:chemotaxis response regulator protein-glutamate methylesterase [Desulfoferrobacter suflitae]MCK8601657.1 chemotaxis response regulator protein-glutamate methylesterase [Desulfoferrobacter suflitae]
MRVAIVNDLLMAVEVLRRVLAAVGDYEIAWIAYNGAEAVEKCAADLPDLVLMDLIMPVMDGVQATCTIMRETPCAILVVTASVRGNAAKVFEAMGCGALDAVATPVLGPEGKIEGGAELLKKIKTISRLIGKPVANEKPGSPRVLPRSAPQLVAIGSSTGGPRALAEILSRLPEDFRASIVIVQHVDVQFAGGLAEWLNEQTHLTVTVASGGQTLREGMVYVAGTNDHLVIGSDLALHYTPEPRDYPYRPSVDTFFFSVEKHWPGKSVAVLLTGMGRDGAKGLLGLKRAGWHTIAQDEQTSIVYGMPRAAAEMGAAVEILPLDRIAESIARHMRSEEVAYLGG